MILDLICKALLAYLLGSISGSLLLGKLRGVDIRSSGSGNAGGTNALRTQGWWFAVAVVAIDVGKGALAAGYLPGLTLITAPATALLSAPVCAFAAIIGHNYPVFFGFRGGKGAATYIGAWLAMLPMVLAPMLGGFALVLVVTGYVGLSTMAAALISVPAAWYLAGEAWQTSLFSYATLAAALIVFSHRANLQRLLAGTENRFNKVRLGYWLRRDR